VGPFDGSAVGSSSFDGTTVGAFDGSAVGSCSCNVLLLVSPHLVNNKGSDKLATALSTAVCIKGSRTFVEARILIYVTV
jgi:hypothetical protein